MSDLTKYQVDHLFLLVGGNPLPNYVAAQLLARSDTTIIFVYSSEVAQQRDVLIQELKNKDFSHFKSIRVEESNPRDIKNRVEEYAKTCTGTIGLHYTGGTKAMATHAYRAVEQTVCELMKRETVTKVYYSYLDARTLSLVLEGTGITGNPAYPVGLSVQVSIKELLALHDMAKLNQEMRQETIWNHVTKELAKIHSVKDDAETWRTWCQQNLRRTDRPDKFVSTTKSLTTDTFPFDTIQEALALELPHCSFPANFETIAKAISFKTPFRKADEKMAQWWDGVWFEDYVYQQLIEIAHQVHIHDMAMTINPRLDVSDKDKDSHFEFDVGCVKGYQLFALSCTTSADKRLCKSKFLEAIVRAEQLGGSETRAALVCCSDDPLSLQKEIRGLFLGEQRTRVFGRHHILELKQHLMEWFKET